MKFVHRDNLMDLKKGLFSAAIGAIVFSGLIAVMALLFGVFNDTTARLLGTTFALGWYGMMASTALGRDGAKPLGVALTGVALGSSLVGSLIAMHLIWTTQTSFGDTEWKWAFTCSGIAFSLSWASLVRNVDDDLVAAVRLLSNAIGVVVGIICLMVLSLVWEMFDMPGEFFFRFLAALTVIAVAGSCALPFVRRLLRKDPAVKTS